MQTKLTDATENIITLEKKLLYSNQNLLLVEEEFSDLNISYFTIKKQLNDAEILIFKYIEEKMLREEQIAKLNNIICILNFNYCINWIMI